MTHNIIGKSLTSVFMAMAFMAIPVQAYDNDPVPVSAQSQAAFAAFVPKPRKSTRLDYGMMDEALSFIVIDLGPSIRTRMSKPQATVGSRFVTGHTSPYRMEGSRVVFDYVTDDYLEGLTEYRKDLERLGTEIDISALSRDEQLAYWFNLHNLTLIEHIAAAYPIDEPSRVKVEIDGVKVPMHDAKILNVKGVALSLRDIRENIVYKNWSNPNVFYGFYRGDIGSPKISRNAFAANRLEFLLNESAGEFVNSLRGFRKAQSHRYVSELYQELDGTLFKDFDRDLNDHLMTYAQGDVEDDVASGRPFKFETYQEDIADLTNGRRLASSGNALLGASTIPQEVLQFMGEAQIKHDNLVRNGIITERGGYVIIEDVVRDDDGGTNETE